MRLYHPLLSILTLTLGLIILTNALLPGSTSRVAATDGDGAYVFYLPLVLTDSPSIAERREVIRLVNRERVVHGCAAADEHPLLMHATQAWSEYMVATGTLAHTSSYPGDWYAEHGWPHPILGETIAGNNSPNGVVAQWMHSPWHRVALLSCDAGPDYPYDIGVGYDSGWTLAISAE